MKVLVSDKIAAEGVKKLKEAGLEVVEAWEEDKSKIPELIKDCDAIIVRSATKVRKPMIDNASKLKVIGRAGVGLDNIDVNYAKSKGIKVINTPGATTVSVAELTMGLMIATVRPIIPAVISTKMAKWEKKKLKGNELYGKTLGIIGIGRIGQAVAERAKAFGMNIIAYDKYIKNSNYKMVDLDTLFRESDIITIHTPLTDETKHLINTEAISKMKDGVIIINAARGGIINEKDLYDGLTSGKIKAAALDVYEVEPPEDTNLLELDNFIPTPHIGAQTFEGQTRAGIEIAEKVIEALKSA